MPPKEAEAFFNSLGDKIAHCNAEWLVKWKGLGYEHATWELESSSFLCTPEAEELKRSYENRLEAARSVSDPAKGDKVCHKTFIRINWHTATSRETRVMIVVYTFTLLGYMHIALLAHHKVNNIY
jgi:hypothetical protein